MLTNILIGLLCYSLCVTLFLVGWHRWQVRMEKLDELSSAMVRASQPRIRFVNKK